MEPSDLISAPYRTRLALDRTMLAWVRTALNLAGFGFAMVAFFRTVRMTTPKPEAIRLHEGAIRFGSALLILGITTMLASAGRYWYVMRRIRRGQSVDMGQWSMTLTL